MIELIKNWSLRLVSSIISRQCVLKNFLICHLFLCEAFMIHLFLKKEEDMRKEVWLELNRKWSCHVYFFKFCFFLYYKNLLKIMYSFYLGSESNEQSRKTRLFMPSYYILLLLFYFAFCLAFFKKKIYILFTLNTVSILLLHTNCSVLFLLSRYLFPASLFSFIIQKFKQSHHHVAHQHGYPGSFLATPPYRLSLLAGLQGYIPYLHRAAVCRFARPCEGVHKST